MTKDTIENIHPVYRDFMMALKPVIDSRSQPFQRLSGRKSLISRAL